MTTEPQLKLCINCKHLARSSLAGPENWKCLAEQNIIARETDLVTGATVVKRHFLTCYDARAEGVKRQENCGPEGRWFEEAPPKFGTARSTATDLLSQLDKLG